jgi:hypothetical protein
VPRGLVGDGFRLEPLGPQHNEPDYAAWTSSLEHIAATPGFEGSGWPHEMTLEENLRDLERHAEDFARREGFAYTVLDRVGDVIGCVYLYPPRSDGHDAAVSSWVRADRAELDVALWRAVSDWLADAWPFTQPQYADR